jgi:hypothetical protein
MRRSHDRYNDVEPSSPPQSSPDYTIVIRGYNFREGQVRLDGLADGTDDGDFEGDRFFADFDIEILRSVDDGLAPHHRSPTSASKPAGQDLRAPLGALNFR